MKLLLFCVKKEKGRIESVQPIKKQKKKKGSKI